MKLLYKIVLSLLILTVAVTAGLILYYLNQVNIVYGNEGYVFGSNPKYHISLILSSEDEKYWQDFKKGAYDAGQKYSAAIEPNPITDMDANAQTVEYINIANKSRLDGIIVDGEKTEEYTEALKNSADSGMGIVVGTGEAVGSITVGTNFYDYGVMASELIVQAGGDRPTINLAVILSDSSDAEISDPTTTTQGTMLKSGLTSEGRINLLCVKYREDDLLGAEDLTRSILTDFPDVDVIFCTNAKDTIAAARVIVERYLVGKVAIVGTDVTDDISDYIKKGIIFGVLDRNGYDAGFKSVEVLCNADTIQTNYITIDSTMYTKMNIDQKKND